MALAMEMAQRAREIVLRHYDAALEIEDKADLSPVTQADRECEAALREMIGAKFPGHGIYGEEFGVENADAELVWVLDPIDGTKSFITGKPLFGTLIGLMKDGAPWLGVMDNPALGEVWAGGPGMPSTRNGKAVRCRPCPELSQAWLHTTAPQMHEGLNFGRFETLRHGCRHAIYGGDCYSYGQLARGRTDLVCEGSLQPYDYVALVPIVEGAGGRMTDWSGDTLGLTGDGRVIAAGDPRAHGLAVAALSG
jgi:inositol-phosphate phosphatase/L-galactose 1-phosphate phosphatase/histidinol-phosphatase